MDASPHDVLHPTFENRKGMVVREGGIVNKQDKPVRGIDWAAIFKERPELSPPGYYETIEALYSKEASDDQSRKHDN